MVAALYQQWIGQCIVNTNEQICIYLTKCGQYSELVPIAIGLSLQLAGVIYILKQKWTKLVTLENQTGQPDPNRSIQKKIKNWWKLVTKSDAKRFLNDT